eukprot:10779139-Prorocentrum_lima.AAC.1
MTSSLVGSEMCIRDRYETKVTEELTSLQLLLQSQMQLQAKADTADTADPVSYTHLTLPTICSV